MVDSLTILEGDAIERLRTLETGSVHCVVTSPPYWGLRDYKVTGQIGLEKTPEEYVAKLVEIFREVRRVLANDGTLWLNLGDGYTSSIDSRGTYSGRRKWQHGATRSGEPEQWQTEAVSRISAPGLKPKDLVGIPWMVAFALRADGWYLRSDIIWHKPNPMPESVRDRPTKSHEYIFLLTKSPRYYYNGEAIAEPTSYWDPRIDDPNFEPPRKDRDQIGAPSRGGGPLNLRKPRHDRFGGNKHNGNTTQHSNGSISESCDFRNKRSVWTINSFSFSGAHFATFPPDLIKPCILAGTYPGGIVLDPFAGSGTTGQVALELGRRAILIELKPAYIPLIKARCNVTPGLPLCA